MGGYLLIARQVGDGAAHLDDAVVGPGRQPQPCYGGGEQLCALRGQGTEPAQVLAVEMGIGTQLVLAVLAILLPLPGRFHPGPERR